MSQAFFDLRRTPLPWVLVAFAASVILFSGCGGGGGGGTDTTSSTASTSTSTTSTTSTTSGTQTGIQVSITPNSVTLQPGTTQKFTAKVTGSTDTAVDWEVVESGGGSVDQTGAYTAPLLKGVYHVQALSDADQTVYAAAIVSVPTSSGNGVITVH